jgi:hypothetical protein
VPEPGELGAERHADVACAYDGDGLGVCERGKEKYQ